jgi:hypothetical protein
MSDFQPTDVPQPARTTVAAPPSSTAMSTSCGSAWAFGGGRERRA